MAVLHIGTATSLALVDHDDISNNDIAYIWLNSYTRKMVFDSTSTKATDTTNHPYYIRPTVNFDGDGVWVESVGSDQPEAWSADQIVTGQLTSTNWAAAAGSQFDLDAGTLEIRQSGGGILIKQGGDIEFEGGPTGDPSILKLIDGAVPGEILFEEGRNDSYFWKMLKEPYPGAAAPGQLFVGPSHLSGSVLNLGKYDSSTSVTAAQIRLYAKDTYLVNLANDVDKEFWEFEVTGTDGDLMISSIDSDLLSSNIVLVLDRAGRVGIGGTPSQHAGLTVTSICIAEITTPTADTNYGKIYCKNDDKLYFQDGAGVEHALAFA